MPTVSHTLAHTHYEIKFRISFVSEVGHLLICSQIGGREVQGKRQAFDVKSTRKIVNEFQFCHSKLQLCCKKFPLHKGFI